MEPASRECSTRAAAVARAQKVWGGTGLGSRRPGSIATAHGRMVHAGGGIVLCDTHMDVQEHEASTSAIMVRGRVQGLSRYVDLRTLVGHVDRERNSRARTG